MSLPYSLSQIPNSNSGASHGNKASAWNRDGVTTTKRAPGPPLLGLPHSQAYVSHAGLALITNGTAEPQRAKVVRFALEHRFDHIQIEGGHGRRERGPNRSAA